MRVITRTMIAEYMQRYALARAPLEDWFAIANDRNVYWDSLDDVRQWFQHADKVGSCYVFNIGGNNFRLVVKIVRELVLVKGFYTHAEYDADRWKSECDCGMTIEPTKNKPRKKK